MSTSPRVTPDDVLSHKGPTSRFLCPLSANTYGLDFLSFTIKDLEENKVLFQISKNPDAPPPTFPPGFDYDKLRTINYTFPSSFLDLTAVGTKLEFRVGSKPVTNFRMIERHYYKNILIKSYDFTFPFSPPDTVNTWETEYDMPQLSSDLKTKVLSGSSQDNQSDTFYFIDDELVMHNKAHYTYEQRRDVAVTGNQGSNQGQDGKETTKTETPESESARDAGQSRE